MTYQDNLRFITGSIHGVWSLNLIRNLVQRQSTFSNHQDLPLAILQATPTLYLDIQLSEIIGLEIYSLERAA
jgi:hypothetical protein